jgi:hypothetical protein
MIVESYAAVLVYSSSNALRIEKLSKGQKAGGDFQSHGSAIAFLSAAILIGNHGTISSFVSDSAHYMKVRFPIWPNC